MTSPADPVSQAGPAPPPARPAPKVLGLPRPVAIIGIAGVAALGILWWRSRRNAQAAAGQAASATAQTVGLQDQLAQLQEEINQLQAQGIGAGSAGGAAGATGGSGTTGAAPPPSAAPPPGGPRPAPPPGNAPPQMTTVPRVTGQRANFAIGELDSAGLKAHLNQERNPAREYTVTSQTPGAGARVPKGSVVDLAIVQSK